MRGPKTVSARLAVGGRVFSANFDRTTGRLRITDGARLLQLLVPPDSWLAIACVSQSSGWGTCPTEADLGAVLSSYVPPAL
jgi:hypothetical protein